MQFFSNLRNQEDAQIIVTGDLTACGNPEQFNSACEFLATTLNPAKGGIGIRAPDHLCKGIPGNHDQWSGTNFPAGPATEALRHCFPNLPFTYSLPPWKTGHYIRFLGIDTDADVYHTGFWGRKKRIFARGDFSSQLETLDNMLHPPDDREIRILLLHHSRMWGSSSNWTIPLSIVNACRESLDDFLVRQKVKILLCGHTHIPQVKSFVAKQSNGLTEKVLECCCGTTTQRDSVPPTWRTFLNKWPNWAFTPNSLLVHRVFEDNNRIEWMCEKYQRTNNGFEIKKKYQPFNLA